MPTYPLATLGCTIDSSGISAPPFADIINSLVASFQSIYGSDVILTPDSQDFQWLAVMAQAFNDQNNATIAAYFSFRPSMAQGAGLASLVLINGIETKLATPSTVTLVVGGVLGTTIPNGVAQDQNGFLWNLPPNTVIPLAGIIAVTAICQTAGEISAPPNTINIPNNQIVGWQTVNNPASAVLGMPVESDGALRTRQQVSTGLPATTPLNSILAAVANVPGVTRYKIYENDEAITDANGIPSHSVSVVVLGGNIAAVALAIEQKKAPGTGTYGTTTVVVEDPAGVPDAINFFQLQLAEVWVTVNIKALNGFVAPTAAAIQFQVATFINSLPIGNNVYFNWLWAAAQLDDDTNILGQSYVITSMFLAATANPASTADVNLPFNQAAFTGIPNIVVNVS